MAKDVSEAISQIVLERGISEELAVQIIETTLLAAYRQCFGTSENALIRFSEDNHSVSIYAQKKIVDGVYDPVSEIELEEAGALNPDAEAGDELLVELDPEDFGRIAIQNARQVARQNIREIRKDSLYSEYKDKEGELIIGYYQRERNGTIYVDLGKIEGVLPKKFQSPREMYRVNDRIKALIYKVEKTQTGLQVVLSRTHTDFVRAIFEVEVPEVYDKTVEIHKIVREPGYRTKLAVYSSRDEVDPVGALVGLKGARIQTVIRELEGEKIDVLKYDPDPVNFIKNALSPAEVRNVVILDEGSKKALAVVSESQLSLAIGKQGLNVRLANRLCDWAIDVKTAAQFEEMDISSESRRAASALFGEYEDEISTISELPNVDMNVAEALRNAGIDYIEDFFNADEEKISAVPGVTPEQIEVIRALINELEVFEEETEAEVADEAESSAAAEAEAGAEAVTEAVTEAVATAVTEAVAEAGVEDEDEYECPECGAKITVDMTSCPNCGVELSFEYE
jgi:N utilization substance protein A